MARANEGKLLKRLRSKTKEGEDIKTSFLFPWKFYFLTTAPN